MEHNTTFSPEAKPAGGGGSASALYGTLAHREISAVRVNQLDAGVLDVELHGLLKTQLGRACLGLPSGTLERFKPEVQRQLWLGFLVSATLKSSSLCDRLAIRECPAGSYRSWFFCGT